MSEQTGSSMASVWLVAQRELKTRLLSKASIISTIIFVVLIAGGIQAAAYFMNSSGSDAPTIGVSEITEPLEPMLHQAAATQGEEVSVLPVAESTAEDLLRDGDIDMFIAGTADKPVFMFDGQPDGSLIGLSTTAVQDYTLFQAIGDAGGDIEQVQAAMANLDYDVLDINPVTSERDLDGGKIVTSVVMVSLLLFALIQSGSLITVGVVEEKASRVVEILLATIRPAHLLGGKVLGIGILALIQVVLFAGVGVLSAMVAGLLDTSQISIGTSIFSLLMWFLLGFAIYVSLFGGLSALVSRQEDIGTITTPMVFGMMIPFYLGMFLIPNAPDATATKVLSQIPFFAPFMMPIRMGFDSVTTWEIVLAIALCLVTIPITIWIGGRVYSRAVLNTGGRMKLSAALRG